MQIALHKILLKLVFIVGFFCAADLIILSPRAEAFYGPRDMLETIGISTGIGTVLGLSTISFYESPTTHLGNALIGAGAGLIVGLGVASYLLANSSDDDEISPEELIIKPKSKELDKKQDPSMKNKTSSMIRRKISAPADRAVYAVASLRPIEGALSAHSSLFDGQAKQYWTFAFPVLELRF